MAQKPSIPSGTRDFSPNEMVKRNFIFDTVKTVFQQFGYAPLETPAMENLQTLLGKYGEEGDKLLFKILNSGNFLSENFSQSDNPNQVALKICEKGLRYDLTVPFARYVVQHQNEIIFPFKRYQIQPVWRADRPQKGRYREFYQCDVDVIGSDSLLNEVELIQIVEKVFNLLNIKVLLKLNNRKILSGIAELVGESAKMMDITIAIDKLDKIGVEKVNQELLEKGISEKAVKELQPFLAIKGDNSLKINTLKNIFVNSEIGKKGIFEMETLFSYLETLKLNLEIEFDISLARGLNYYTGTIFEVKAKNSQIGSICGGGRYDDLTGIFGLKNLSGVGISFGADRIFDVMQEQNLFSEKNAANVKLLFVNFGEKETFYLLPLLKNIREMGISCELYPESAKIKKQMEYANKKNIPFVALVGENEISHNTLIIKDMNAGTQNEISLSQLTEFVR